MRRLLLLALLALGSACAPRVSVVSNAAGQVPPVRAAVPDGQAEVVWSRAVRLLTTRGYGLVICDDGRSALRTGRLELEAPCGGTTCLARQSVTVKVGLRAVRLSIRREVWDSTARGWLQVTDPRAVADVVRTERALLGEVLAQVDRWDLQPLRLETPTPCPEPAPCGPGECDLTGLASN